MTFSHRNEYPISTNAKLKGYTEIINLPIRVESKHNNPLTMKQLHEWIVQDKQWKNIPDLTLPNTSKEKQYQVIAYFHSAVRQILFDQANDYFNQKIRLYRREDVKTIQFTIEINKKEEKLLFDVQRCDLWCFQPDTIILQIELKCRNIPTWNVFMNFRDAIRRISPPYFDNNELGRMPYKIEINTESKQATEASDYLNHLFEVDQNDLGISHEKLEEFVIDATWKSLLPSLENGSSKLRLIPPDDERMPILSFILVDNPRHISRGDMLRLTFADDYGKSKYHPYASHFFKDFEERFCYDRFWYNEKDNKTEPSRILNCGYAFTYLISESSIKWLEFNFSQIYSRAGLLAFFQKHTLQSMSHRLSQLTSRNPETGELDYIINKRDKILETYHQFMEFTQIYWFAELSPQEQGAELMQMWHKHLKTVELYHEVRQQLQDLMELLKDKINQEEKDLTKNIAYGGLVIGVTSIAATLFGIQNIYSSKDFSDISMNFIATLLIIPIYAAILWGVIKLWGIIKYYPSSVRNWIVKKFSEINKK